MNSLNTQNRSEIRDVLANEHFDCLIIGGGITGVGIALDAVSRGLKVALIEMQDYSAGTSSRSTKLIHGGLRYLKNFEIGLVMETGRERSILHHNATNLIHPERMLLPLIKKGSLGKWTTKLALTVYDFLAGVPQKDRKMMLRKAETLALQPGLNALEIIGGALYSEYRTDDSRLTISVLKTAVDLGVVALNYVKCENLLYDHNNVSAVEVIDLITNKRLTIKAKTIVNSTGPWVDEIRKIDNSLKSKHLHLTKGVHIVVRNEKIKLNQACYMEITDGRMIFAIPREETIYIGTTDTNYANDKLNPQTELDDIAYLLRAINHMFPNVSLDFSDIISHWSGLRPLIAHSGKNNNEISRKDEIFESPSGLISIAGGKLTAYRKMAERVVNLINKRLQLKMSSKTKNMALKGCCSKETFTQQFNSFFLQFNRADLWTQHYWSRYGLETEKIIEAFHFHKFEVNNESALLKSELIYCMSNESCLTLYDFLMYRNAMLLFNPDLVKEHLSTLSDFFQNQNLATSEQFINDQEKIENWFRTIDGIHSQKFN